MTERGVRIAALVLVVVLVIAFFLLASLLGSLTASNSSRRAAEQNAALGTVSSTSTLPLPTNAPALALTLTSIPPTATPTLPPSPLPSPTTGCPNPATPEPLWVDPVVSPTNLLTQTLTITLGRGREITVSSEAGTVTREGNFSIAQPVAIEVPLVPNGATNLIVSGRVEFASGCFYTLQTRTDRTGHPLVIVQSSAPSAGAVPPTVVSPTPTPPMLIGTPPPGAVYLKPFSQVFGLNQDTPASSEKVWLYEANADAPFQVVAQQGAFTRLVGQGGSLDFWTLNENVVETPAPPPQYDTSVQGQAVQFVSSKVFACEAEYPGTLVLGACAEYNDLGQGAALERALVESSVLYLVQVNGKPYWVSANSLKLGN